MVVREAEGPELDLVPAGAQAEDQPAAADLVDGGGLLGEHRRVVERGRGDQRPELDPLGDRGQAGELTTPPTAPGRPPSSR